VFEVPVLRDAVVVDRVGSDGRELVVREDVELAFYAFGVGVLGLVETATGVAHVAEQVLERLDRDPAI
jgi:hypothetical protein